MGRRCMEDAGRTQSVEPPWHGPCCEVRGWANAATMGASWPSAHRISACRFSRHARSRYVSWLTQPLLREENVHDFPPTCVAFAPNSRALVSGSADSTVRVRVLPSGMVPKLSTCLCSRSALRRASFCPLFRAFRYFRGAHLEDPGPLAIEPVAQETTLVVCIRGPVEFINVGVRVSVDIRERVVRAKVRVKRVVRLGVLGVFLDVFIGA